MIWMRKPNLKPDDLVQLEKLGPVTVRDQLTKYPSGRLFVTHGPERDVALRWLEWKATIEAAWIKVGVVAAVVAAVLSCASWLIFLR